MKTALAPPSLPPLRCPWARSLTPSAPMELELDKTVVLLGSIQLSSSINKDIKNNQVSEKDIPLLFKILLCLQPTVEEWHLNNSTATSVWTNRVTLVLSCLVSLFNVMITTDASHLHCVGDKAHILKPLHIKPTIWTPLLLDWLTTYLPLARIF